MLLDSLRFLVVQGNVTGNLTGNITGSVNATGLSTFSGGINVGNTFLRATSIGIGTTTPQVEMLVSQRHKEL
jgi:hypothetical protein